MTEKELRHLKRAELLEILFYLQKENESLRTELETLKQNSKSGGSDLSPEAIQQIKQIIQETMKEINKEINDEQP